MTKELNEMTMEELALASVDSYFPYAENIYLEEMCRRTGNLDAFRKDPEKASKAAAKGAGMILI